MKRSKYNSSKVVIGDSKYDSKREYHRHLVLLDREKRGEIWGLRRQVEFVLLPPVSVTDYTILKTKVKVTERNIQQPIKYFADFVYYENGEYIVEDVKISKKLQPSEYVLKKKMLFYRYGIVIREYYG